MVRNVSSNAGRLTVPTVSRVIRNALFTFVLRISSSKQKYTIIWWRSTIITRVSHQYFVMKEFDRIEDIFGIQSCATHLHSIKYSIDIYYTLYIIHTIKYFTDNQFTLRVKKSKVNFFPPKWNSCFHRRIFFRSWKISLVKIFISPEV